jgi:hypothetical protein
LGLYGEDVERELVDHRRKNSISSYYKLHGEREGLRGEDGIRCRCYLKERRLFIMNQ